MMQIATYTENLLLDYIEKKLIANGGQYSSNPYQSFRKRSEHCWRVMKWCVQISQNENIPDIDTDELLLSALFHDVGYNCLGIPHEEYGVKQFKEFIEIYPVDHRLAEKIIYNIRHHSQKENLIPKEESIELQILMEADLLDEEGCMGIVADCLSEGMKGELCSGYSGAYNRIKSFASEILEYSPMTTPYAAKCWKQKQEEVRMFLYCFKKSCFIMSE